MNTAKCDHLDGDSHQESVTFIKRENQLNLDLAPCLKLPGVNRSISPNEHLITGDDQTKVKLKRLKFITKSLEGHNSQKYLELSREEAHLQKQKRVWELWK